MPINGPFQTFRKQNVDDAPSETGVYGLYDSASAVMYYGRAAGITVTIRTRLQSHLSGIEGPCTRAASYFNFEVTQFPTLLEEELLREYLQSFGQLPACNERAA